MCSIAHLLHVSASCFPVRNKRQHLFRVQSGPGICILHQPPRICVSLPRRHTKDCSYGPKANDWPNVAPVEPGSWAASRDRGGIPPAGSEKRRKSGQQIRAWCFFVGGGMGYTRQSLSFVQVYIYICHYICPIGTNISIQTWQTLYRTYIYIILYLSLYICPICHSLEILFQTWQIPGHSVLSEKSYPECFVGQIAPLLAKPNRKWQKLTEIIGWVCRPHEPEKKKQPTHTHGGNYQFGETTKASGDLLHFNPAFQHTKKHRPVWALVHQVFLKKSIEPTDASSRRKTGFFWGATSANRPPMWTMGCVVSSCDAWLAIPGNGTVVSSPFPKHMINVDRSSRTHPK